MEIAEFLLARIAEDEAAARAGQAARLPFWVGQVMGRSGSFSAPNYVNRFNPSRVLAECEAKRRIVEMALDTVSVSQQAALSRGEVPSVGGLGEVLQFLALPYADHEDYDQSWLAEVVR